MAFFQVSTKDKNEVVNGFRLAGGLLLGMALMGGLVVCTGVAFGTVESSRVSRPAAFPIALGSLVLITVMVQRWAKYFAGWIGFSVFNALIVASSGHVLNNPSIPVAHWLALSLAALFFISALVSLRFTKNYTLNLLDKVALITWVLAFTLAANVEKLVLAATSLGCAALVTAWWYHRATGHSRAHPAQRHRSKPNTAL